MEFVSIKNIAEKTGFISQIIGPVLDIEFPNGELPKVYNALVIISGEDSIGYTSINVRGCSHLRE